MNCKTTCTRRHLAVKYVLFCCGLFVCVNMHAQTNNNIDVLHYNFALQLNDSNDVIKGEAVITIKILRPAATIDLDLVNKQGNGKGMTVTVVKENNAIVTFRQEEELLHINSTSKAGDTATYNILYEGIPADGLIIATNKYGHRTFFSDNWPNRAHHWLPCIDHPSDKAAVDFMVTAPEHYQIISNGLQVEETNLPNHLTYTHWKETVNLPIKVMVIGAADFAVNYTGSTNGIPVYSWVYPEDRGIGFYDYALAKDILPFFITNVGPYAYQKLANVQSKTMFGGMENASAIFYSENSVKGDRKVEALLVHEIAHQWFGNSATESNWQHIWLSESFATFMTHFYIEKKYGTDSLLKRLQHDRQYVIAFSKKNKRSIVDTTVTSNFMQLLNANSYEKGAWVLYMLRKKLGAAVFLQGIKNYYAQYAGKNADTDDFRKVMEATSKQDLRAFFQQWLYTTGQPAIKGSWRYDNKKKTLSVTIAQTQETLFTYTLPIGITSGHKTLLREVGIKDKTTAITVNLPAKPAAVVLDPQVTLLFEGTLTEEK